MKHLLVICVLLVIGNVQSARIRRQIPAAAGPPAGAAGMSPMAAKTAGMNLALGSLVDELDKEEALGGPVNPAGLKKATILALKIQMLGGEVDKPTQDKLDSLTADFLLEAAQPPDFAGSIAKPEDTNVNIPAAPAAAV